MLPQIAEEFLDTGHATDFFESEMNFLMSELRSRYCCQNDTFSNKVCVAVSGGADSMALLVMTVDWAKKHSLEVICVTVDHGLRAESEKEAVFVKDFCESLAIEHHILFWDQKDNQEICMSKIGKLERLAREARYDLLKDFCLKKSIEILLIGHNWNDQLETFEMRKEFGSSSTGLACMSRIRSLYTNIDDIKTLNYNGLLEDVFLLRPLLHFTKEYLRAFLREMKIEWRNDPMNDQEIFRRVFHRRRIAFFDDDKLRRYFCEIKKFGERRRKIEKEAVDFLKNYKFCEFSNLGYITINLGEFLKKSMDAQCEIMKRCIWDIGGKKYPPNIFNEILQKIMTRKINTIGRCLLKINKKQIKIFRENRGLCKKKELLNIAGCIFNNFLLRINGMESELSNDFTKYVVLCLGSSGIITGGLPAEASFGLPCVFCDHTIVFVCGIGYVHSAVGSEITCNFLHRADLFDVFL